MGRPKTKTYGEQLKDKYGDKIENLEPYINLNTKILHRCNYHNYEYYSTPSSVLGSKYGCPKCGEESHKRHSKERMAYTNDEYKQLLNERFNGNIINLEPIKGTNISIKHFCKIHQYEYTLTPESVLNNKHGCKYCGADAVTKSKEEKSKNIKNKIYELVGNEYEIVDDYFSLTDIVKFKHNHPNGEIHYFNMTPTSFIYRNARCYCVTNSMNKVIIGVNDINTVRPDLINFLNDSRDAYKYTMHSKEKLEWNCPECHNTFKEAPCNIASNKLSCPFCSDGISYPNKFIYNSLHQIEDDLNFLEREYKPDWCSYDFNGIKKRGIYDIYFGLNNKGYVIEMDGGIGHGNKAHTHSEYSSDELETIDNIKDNLAKEHNIQVIRIDCNYKRDNKYLFILNNILQSELHNIIDLSKIDFELSNKISTSSIIVRTGELWNKGLTAGEIRNQLKIGEGTVTSYLKTAAKIGICDYTTKKSNARSRYKKVYSITFDKIYDSMSLAAKECKTNRSSIKRCCEGKYESSKNKDGIYLKWMYYEDYLKSTAS
jgi:hypothetical protein|nr:MAG TPA: restriction enzyme [Bacteriophage sp.]